MIEALLLAAIFIAERRRGDRRPAVVRGLSCALVFILVAEAVFVTVRLVTDLVEGGPETNSASDLLGVGSGVPTDVMPLARSGKLAMTVQAIGSLAVLGLVIARAVNIFN